MGIFPNAPPGWEQQQQQALVNQLDQTLKQARALLSDIDSLKIFPLS